MQITNFICHIELKMNENSQIIVINRVTGYFCTTTTRPPFQRPRHTQLQPQLQPLRQPLQQPLQQPQHPLQPVNQSVRPSVAKEM